jgi:hypothetical protein
VNGVLLTAEHLDLGHAAHHRDSLSDPGLCVLVERPGRHRRRGDDQIQDRLIRRIDLREGWRRRHPLRQQSSGLRDRRLDVDRGAIEVAIEVELERHLRRPERID